MFAHGVMQREYFEYVLRGVLVRHAMVRDDQELRREQTLGRMQLNERRAELWNHVALCARQARAHGFACA